MKLLTKIALVVTCISAIILLLTSEVTQSLESDGKQMFDIVLWHVPFYRSVQLPDRAGWVLVWLSLFSLSLPPILWVAVGIRKIFAKTNLQ
jgi:hypothetical protein